MAISTWQDVIAELRKSQLLAPDELDEAIVATRDLSDPSTIARKLVSESLLTRWQAAELISGRIPLKIGKYRLRDQTGFTDLGPVYAAENIETGNRVELQTISQKLDTSSPDFKRFVKEARVIASIVHPNLVRIGEILLESGTVYLVTEEHGGRDLRRFVEKQHPLSPELATDYIRQAADGMAEVHSRDLVHRELRPDNLFADEEGTIKIGGLGMACLAKSPQQKATAADADKYLSPEQANGEEAGPASDVFALGGIFYYLLTGRPPFSNGSSEQRPENALLPISEFRSDVTEEIVAVCETMLATSLESRYADASDVVAALSSWQPTTPEADDAPTSVIPLNLKNANDSASSLAIAARAARNRGRPAVQQKTEAADLEFPSSAIAANSETKSSPHPRTGQRKHSQIFAVAIVGLFLLVAGGVVAYSFLPEGDTRLVRKPGMAPKVNLDSREAGNSRSDKPQKPATVATPIAAESSEHQVAGRDSNGNNPPNVPHTATATTDDGEATTGENTETKPPEEVDPQPAPQPLPQPTPQPKPPPTSSKPFTLEQLAETVSLPPPESENTDPVLIGTLPGALPEDFAISLHSNPAEPGRVNRKFSCEKEGGEETASLQGRSWRVTAGTGEATENAKPIARLVLSEEQLQIHWTENAAGHASASHLQNCLLDVRGGGQERFVPLRQPSDFPELKLKFPGPNSFTVPVAAMPDSQYLRVQIIGLQGLNDETTPQQFREARSLLDKPHDETTIELGAGGSRVLIGIKSRAVSLKKKPYLKIELNAAVAVDEKSKPLPYAEFVKTFTRLDVLFITNQEKLKNLKQARKAAQVGQKMRFNNPIALVMAQIAKMKPTIDKWRASREVIKGVGGNSRLHFRVYYEVGGRQVDLIRTVVGKEPAEPEPKRRPGKK
ncbi:MAG: serine/threonine-protein kinase [Planctomycetota bacterium]|nr:serine/threonine-protein kinase [Planctomycetota bacterium]